MARDDLKISEIASHAGFAVTEDIGYEYTFANGDYLTISNPDGNFPLDDQTHLRVGRYDCHGTAADGHYQEGTVISVESLSNWIAEQLGNRPESQPTIFS